MTRSDSATAASDRAANGPSPAVSVVLLTYNHEQYITAALRSVLDQADAPLHEILVAEDCSTDQTRDVLAQLERAYPNRFTVLPRERNLGLSRNLEDAIRRCRGKYIALLEGDDYWHDPHKLKRVCDQLEQHPHWSGCFHAVRVRREPQEQYDAETLPAGAPRPEVDLESLIRRQVIVPTYSCMTYRAGMVTAFPDWHRRQACSDWGLHVLYAEHGPLGYLPEVLATYRVHESGMWSAMDETRRWQQMFSLWSALDLHFQGRYAELIEQARNQFIEECQLQLTDLRKIERRYHQLQLHRIAAAVQWCRRQWQRLTGRHFDER